MSVYIAAGAANGFMCAVVGLLGAGAGHGWVSPWSYGLASILIAPILYWLIEAPNDSKLPSVLLILSIGSVLSFLLYIDTLSEGVHYFHKNISYNIFWLVLWFSWQLIPVTLILMKYKHVKNT